MLQNPGVLFLPLERERGNSFLLSCADPQLPADQRQAELTPPDPTRLHQPASPSPQITAGIQLKDPSSAFLVLLLQEVTADMVGFL